LIDDASLLQHDKVFVEPGMVHAEGSAGSEYVDSHIAFAEPLKEIIISIK